MSPIVEQVAPNVAILGEDDINVQRIVVGVDLLDHCKRTALYAIALAKGFGAWITFVHVFPSESTREFSTEDFHRRYAQERDAAKGRLARFRQTVLKIYPRCETEFHIGDTAEQVHQVAISLKANLIVTASYHPGFLGHLLGLEQARRIATHAPCTVLVFHGCGTGPRQGRMVSRNVRKEYANIDERQGCAAQKIRRTKPCAAPRDRAADQEES